MNFAFVKWYPGNFLSGTAHLSNEEVGAYIRLLCWQASSGSLPNDYERLRRLADGMSHDTWQAIRDKFQIDEVTGELRNPRMHEEMETAKARVEGAKKAAEKRWSSKDAPAKPTHMPTDNRTDMPKKEGRKEGTAKNESIIDFTPGESKDENVIRVAEASCSLGLDRIMAFKFATKLFQLMPDRKGTEFFKDLIRRSKTAKVPSAYFRSAVKKEFGL
jgi:uncharacterized protein YdaU (DUF1376 family)